MSNIELVAEKEIRINEHIPKRQVMGSSDQPNADKV